MTQNNLKEGLKKFGTAGINAVQEELKHFDVHDVFSPLHSNKTSLIEKSEALLYLMFLMQKQSSKKRS
jgi:hypothetical protein